MLGREKILCVDSDPDVLKAFRRLFMLEDSIDIFAVETCDEGLDILDREGDICIVICACRPSGMAGVDFLQRVRNKWPEVMRMALSAAAETAGVVAALSGVPVRKIITKPWNDEELQSTVALAFDFQKLQRKNKRFGAALQQKDVELEKIHERLEEQVIKRTEALDIRNRILQVSQGVLDVLPIIVFGIDPEDLIVHCNEYAREIFPHGGMGPLGNERKDVFPPEINKLIDRLENERLPQASIEVHNQKFRGEVRRLHDTQLQGSVLVLIPES